MAKATVTRKFSPFGFCTAWLPGKCACGDVAEQKG
jgi:hypothetical protein